MAILSTLVGPTLAKKSASVIAGHRNLDPKGRLPLHSKLQLQIGRSHSTHATPLTFPSSPRKIAGRTRCRNRLEGRQSRNRRAGTHAFHQGKEGKGEAELVKDLNESDKDLHFRLSSSQEDRKEDSTPLSKAEMKGMKAGFLRWLRGSGRKRKAVDPALEKEGQLAKIESLVFQFSRQLGKYTFAMTGTGAILATGFQLSGDWLGAGAANTECSTSTDISATGKDSVMSTHKRNLMTVALVEDKHCSQQSVPIPGPHPDGDPREQAVLWFSWAAGIVLGSMIGADQVLKSHAQRGPRNVVITGSTRGLGKALAREFLRAGDNVVVTSRSEEDVAATVAELQMERAMQMPSSLSGPIGLTFLNNSTETHSLQRVARLPDTGRGCSHPPQQERRLQKVVGIACSVQSSTDVKQLAATAARELGTVDIWINNAGSNAGAKPLIECSDSELQAVVSTNLMGSLLCTREAILRMKKQPRGGHVFNMDGAGSGGSATPKYAAYGATKCGLRQLGASLQEECKKGRVGIHTASPGMVLTDLLLSGATLENKQVFNIVCEQPETVAQALVPRLRAVRGQGQAINYLTPPRIVLALVTAWLRRGRWFDEEGQAVYAAEADRLRMWAEGEGKRQSPLAAAMELAPSSAWISLFSSSVICAYIMLSNLGEAGPPGGGGL